MSELLKLKFTPYYIKETCEKVWNVDVVYVDKNLIGESIEVFERDDEYSEWYSILLNDCFVKLRSWNPQGEETLIYLNLSGCFVKNKNLEKTKNALKMLKPKMEEYRNILHEKKLEEDKRKELWLEKEPFEFIL